MIVYAVNVRVYLLQFGWGVITVEYQSTKVHTCLTPPLCTILLDTCVMNQCWP